jgi:hypothetical protein
MTKMQDKIVTMHQQSCPASLSYYYLGVMDTEQIIHNLVLHPCHVIASNMTRMQDKIVDGLFCIHYAEVIT